MKLFDYVTTIPLWEKHNCSTLRSSMELTSGFLLSRSPSQSKNISMNSELNINKIRIHYFFTKDEQIDSLLKDTRILIKITTGPSWNSPSICNANANILKGLNEKLTGSAQKSEYIITLFMDSIPQLFGHLRVFFTKREFLVCCWCCKGQSNSFAKCSTK